MSSPRASSSVSGLIRRGDLCTGPIQLPNEAADAFLEEFNRLYGGINLRVEPSAAKQPTSLSGDAEP